MPRKIRELISDLKRAGFVDRGGKGSHRNFVHPKVAKPVTVAGLVRAGMMLNSIRNVLSNVLLRNQSYERKYALCQNRRVV